MADPVPGETLPELARTEPGDPSDPAPSGAPTAVTSQLGRYRLERELGAGAMGVVHAAYDPDLERRVAIKVLKGAPGNTARQRLLREARAMARLAHPNVVTVHEVDTIDNRDFVAMELVEGTTLTAWLAEAPRSEAEILDAFVAAAHGLAAAHAVGLVHRDFKPSNVLRSTGGRVLVSDFGLARADALDVDAGGHTSTSAEQPMLTATGMFVGTPAYMPPEQWAGGTVSAASDQFAFCVALWEALAGERPYRGTTLDELREAIERGPAPADASRIPRRLRPVLARGLEPDPAKRWPSMEALLAATARARRSRVLPIAAGLAAAVLAGVAVIAGVTRHRSAADPAPGDPAVAAAEAARIPPDRQALLATIEKVDDTHYRVPRATLEQLLATRQIADDVRLVPVRRDDAIVGYKLFAVRPRSVYAAFGFRDLDVIDAIDGVAPSSTEQLVAVASKLRTASSFTVAFERAGSAHELVIEIR